MEDYPEDNEEDPDDDDQKPEAMDNNDRKCDNKFGGYKNDVAASYQGIVLLDSPVAETKSSTQKQKQSKSGKKDEN